MQAIPTNRVMKILIKALSFRRYPEFAQLFWWRTFVPYAVRRVGVNVGKQVEFFGMPLISTAPSLDLVFGDTVRVNLASDSKTTAVQCVLLGFSFKAEIFVRMSHTDRRSVCT